MKATIATILLLLTLCVAETEFNLEKEKSKLSNKVFNHYDIDKSKTLSFEEFSTFSKEMREKELEKRVAMTIKFCDKNGNGKIESSEVPTPKEMREMFVKRKNIATMCHMDSIRFKIIDKDNSKSISREEILLSFKTPMAMREMINRVPKIDKLQIFKDRLKRCDKNEDGNISLIEATSRGCYITSDTFLQYSPNYKTSFKIDKVAHAPKHNKKEEIEYDFKKCDSNSDNNLTLVEATSKWCHLTSDDFIELDRDKNNYLDKREFSQMYAEDVKPPKMPFKIMKDMPPEAKIHIAFAQCDEDENRKMSRDEAKKCEISMEIFNRFDYDKSNTIEQNDLETMQRHREFERVDMNSDKKIDQKEFAERMGNRCRVF